MLLDPLPIFETKCNLKRLLNSLKQHFQNVFMTDSDMLAKRLSNLMFSFSRHVGEANSQLEDRKKNIEAVQILILADLQAPAIVREGADYPLTLFLISSTGVDL